MTATQLGFVYLIMPSQKRTPSKKTSWGPERKPRPATIRRAVKIQNRLIELTTQAQRHLGRPMTTAEAIDQLALEFDISTKQIGDFYLRKIHDYANISHLTNNRAA